MSLNYWALFAGVLLLALVLLGSWLDRLPLSSALLYLIIGWLLGRYMLGLQTPNLSRDTATLEHAAELALLISLFAVGLQLGVPLQDRRWLLPVRLAFASMLCLVAMITAIGVWLLHLPLGAAVLLGAILAPTDPVLAKGVQSESGQQPDPVGFSLAGEGGLNDGAAFPFVLLGLGLLGHADGASWLMIWWGRELLWATLAGLVVGAAVGTFVGRLVVYLRGHHGEAVGLDVFLGLGLIALAYGLSQALHASGFLAVFAAGLALQRVRERPLAHEQPLQPSASGLGPEYDVVAAHSHHASATMRSSVQLFNGQIEKLGELTLVLIVGAMLAGTPAIPAAWWFVPLLLLVLRPLSAVAAVTGEGLTLSQSALIGWFGIRGIGSVFYLLYALRMGLASSITDTLVSLTLWTVAGSILLHGLSAQPLMRRYLKGESVPP